MPDNSPTLPLSDSPAPAPEPGPADAARRRPASPELRQALDQALAAEKRLAKEADDLNARLATLLNDPQTQQLLRGPAGAEMKAAARPGPLRLKLDARLAHPPRDDEGPAIPLAPVLVVGLLGTVALAWLALRLRTMRGKPANLDGKSGAA
ncbi:hypothetical protein [Noviherbaspirillum galbum]|uniref:Uncharacterized protein n=1 Tax=Noviherbaspirillum galbum TaxID=2709383 RepID=A0A6B3SMD5_9BURK|nr:hypothetical protein [Noviherbaspirillum galbum]NEX62010.1 hypothetical protein [Noviherbaspirillum galbum]